MEIVGNDWDQFLKEQFRQKYYKQLINFLIGEYEKNTIYPAPSQWFTAFQMTPYEQVKVVILGQDPYHGPKQAHGLAFSVPKGEKTPPSLRNIFKELEADMGITPPAHGNLESWARQGVLLLNTVLTVRAGQANSHRDKGWETFTDAAIAYLNQREKPMVFLLWGSNAQKKEALITNSRHYILKAAHPSPLSAHRGFFGCGHFSKTRRFLDEHRMKIDFCIPT